MKKYTKSDNVLIIEQGKDFKFRGFERCLGSEFHNPQPVFVEASLESAIKKAETYCNENIVRYNYRVKLECY